MRKISLKGLFCPKSLESKQIILTMKITLFLLLFVTFQAYCENGYSQSAKISIPRSTLKVSELLSKIESQTDYLFVYNKQTVDVKRVVNVSADNQPVSEILDRAFKGTGIRYVMEGNNIVLTKQVENSASTQQQKIITVKGVVTDARGEGIIGASIVEKGTTNGTITDLDGNFTLKLPADAVLNVSYVGYQSQSIPVNGQTTFNIKMEEEAMALEQVVVTAMGIKKKEASLTYSTQQVGGDELTRAKDPNMINALAGKTAGVQITKSAAGLGGSAKVSIRGARSAFASGNNQPLYVIDGVPMLNNSTESTATVMGGENDGVNRDAGDGVSNLNPEDIESMSILKGASAAALYGSQAANGVILITTKKGKAGMQKVTFSSNLTVDHAISLPEFQNSYGRMEGGTSSWGKEGNLTDYNNVDNFFSNGVTAINTVSFMGGNDKSQTYFSYANTTAKGIIDSNKLQKHNLTFRETASFFNDRLKLDGNVNLMTQTIKNSPSSGGYYLNPLVNIYGFPRGMDMAPYRDNFELYDADRNMNLQNWYVTNEDGSISEWDQNPYWIKNRVTNRNKRYRAMASLTANVKVNSWFTLQARGNVDFVSDKFENKMYASTSPNIAGTYDGLMNGRYVWSDSQNFQVYGDLMAMFNKTFNKFSINGAVGTSINATTANSLMIDSKLASLYHPNVFTVPNVVSTSKAAISHTIDSKRTIQSVFATAQLGWDEMLYLDLTARNDWSSTLANTNSKNSGFFYPSVGLTWILSKTLKMPDWISFSKIRGSWAQVGNDLPIGITSLADIVQAGGAIQVNDREHRGDLKPEISTSFEVGTEWRFFNSRLGIDFTWYQTDTKNQLLMMPNPAGSLYAYRYINAGKIRNKGFELTVDGTPLMNDNFRWKTAVNVSANRNKVVSLHPDYTQFSYGQEGFSMAYQMRIKEGGKLGDIYGNAFVRNDDGFIQVNADGSPVNKTGNKDLLGNANPDCLLGWSNTFTYKGFTLYFLVDARIGGDVMSLTEADLDSRGVTKATAEARDRGYVEYNGQRFENVKGFYGSVGGRNGISEYYMYDATNIRLRELSLSYALPRTWLAKTKVFQGIDVSFVARNLFFFYKDAPFDPDATLSVGNNNQGVDVFGMPTTRNIGFNVKFTF
ncbi:TonB-dependent receptor [Bacteroides congonensis]|uniref:TonB-dependent receptor n=1 Tax=Bacteroides congonensis TaxID=1871006 RepID=UPI000934AEB3|nr:TonB-dependent receptor [Bacteroides congonensis]